MRKSTNKNNIRNKRIFIFFLSASMILSAVLMISACGNKDEGENALPVSGQVSDEATETNASTASDITPTDSSVTDIPDNTPEPDKPDNTPKPDNTDSSHKDKNDEDARSTDDGDILVLVNKENPVSSDYKPSGMVSIDGSLSTNQNLKVKKVAYEAYLEMLKDAKKEDLNFCICSAYRSYALQESLYDRSVAANGKAYTDKMTAYPGKSEHHTGLAIDITSASMNWGLSQNFINYPDGAWITENCANYGFIIRYPKGKEDITGYNYEPWHIRYVGVDIATYIMENDLTLEEYLEAL